MFICVKAVDAQVICLLFGFFFFFFFFFRGGGAKDGDA